MQPKNKKKINRNKLGCLIFARSNSRRLPRKTMYKINNIPIIQIIYMRACKVFPEENIVVATSKNSTDNKLANFCKSRKIKCFRGSLENVYDRALQCCKKYKFSSFVRICGDSPFFDYHLAKKMISNFQLNNSDIVTNKFPKTYPVGHSCEIIKLTAFKKIKKNKMFRGDQEHIFNYFYRNSEDFKIKNFFSGKTNKFKNVHLAIDYKEDFLKINSIFKKSNFNYLISSNYAIKIAESLK